MRIIRALKNSCSARSTLQVFFYHIHAHFNLAIKVKQFDYRRFIEDDQIVSGFEFNKASCVRQLNIECSMTTLLVRHCWLVDWRMNNYGENYEGCWGEENDALVVIVKCGILTWVRICDLGYHLSHSAGRLPDPTSLAATPVVLRVGRFFYRNPTELQQYFRCTELARPFSPSVSFVVLRVPMTERDGLILNSTFTWEASILQMAPGGGVLRGRSD